MGEVYWCDFSPMNWTPEFDYQHLVVIVRGGKVANDIHVVLPLTKADQSANPHGCRLRHNPNPGSSDVSWAVCNHLYSVASERLHADDLHEVSRRLLRALETFLTLGFPAASSGTPTS